MGMSQASEWRPAALAQPHTPDAGVHVAAVKPCPVRAHTSQQSMKYTYPFKIILK